MGKSIKTDEENKVYWEVEAEAGGKITLNYKYYTLE
jgi:hypothetical protein